jgi:hypothetical protein
VKVWLLTGTPAPNGRPIELEPLLDVIGHPVVQDLATFREKHCKRWNPTKNAVDLLGSNRMQELGQALKTGPGWLRRTGKDVPGELPDFLQAIVPLAGVLPPLIPDAEGLGPDTDQTAARAALFQAAADLGIQGFDPTRSDEIPGRERLSAYCRDCGLAKVPSVAAWFKDWTKDHTGSPIVLFAKHRVVIETLAETIGAPFVHGGHSAGKRQQIISEWLKTDTKPALVASIGACGTGLDGLQHKAVAAAIVELVWNPSELTQAIARVVRKGSVSVSPVLIYELDAGSSLESRLRLTLRRKTGNTIKMIGE